MGSSYVEQKNQPQPLLPGQLLLILHKFDFQHSIISSTIR